MPHDVDHRIMANGVKGFCKIQFEQYDAPFRCKALMDILEGPSEAILDRSPTNEAILVTMNNSQDEFLQPVSKELSNEF